jgi:hypothetical protein
MHPIILSVMLFVFSASDSPFNSYAVFLSPRKLPDACASGSVEEFRNRTYTFRSDKVYPFGTPVTLSDGKLIERNLFGTPEWETSLVSSEGVSVAGRDAVLLVVGADHVNGSGGASHVLVVECREQKLFVLFEASGEGLREAAFVPHHGLTVTRWVWTSTDAHCCPSKEAEERYDWKRAAGRFVRVTSAERSARK